MSNNNHNNQWTSDNISDLTGKTAIVTGANSGLGLETSRVLAAKGAHVIMACRSEQRGSAALEEILAMNPKGEVELMLLDLADLSSVRRFAEAFKAAQNQLDLLINNAGIMAIPYNETADGFEMQFGTNHLGHFALTGLLLDTLLQTPGSRVVILSSMAHRFGKINFDDLNAKRSYQRWMAYSQSKLSNLLFMQELQRRLQAAGQETIAVATHPGWTATNLQSAHARMTGSKGSAQSANLANRLFAQRVDMGALPTLYAAVAEDVQGGDYYGPNGLFEAQGYPKKVLPNRQAQDMQAAARLWAVSEEFTNVHYEALKEVK